MRRNTEIGEVGGERPRSSSASLSIRSAFQLTVGVSVYCVAGDEVGDDEALAVYTSGKR